MTSSLFCNGINFLLDFAQTVVDVFFFWLSFVGTPAPDLRFGVGSYLGCNL